MQIIYRSLHKSVHLRCFFFVHNAFTVHTSMSTVQYEYYYTSLFLRGFIFSRTVSNARKSSFFQPYTTEPVRPRRRFCEIINSQNKQKLVKARKKQTANVEIFDSTLDQIRFANPVCVCVNIESFEGGLITTSGRRNLRYICLN